MNLSRPLAQLAGCAERTARQDFSRRSGISPFRKERVPVKTESRGILPDSTGILLFFRRDLPSRHDRGTSQHGSNERRSPDDCSKGWPVSSVFAVVLFSGTSRGFRHGSGTFRHCEERGQQAVALHRGIFENGGGILKIIQAWFRHMKVIGPEDYSADYREMKANLWLIITFV